MNADRPNHVPEIRRALTDVRAICDALGLTAQGGKTVLRQATGLIVRCVWHQENTPSMSVRIGDDGTIAIKCHGCDRGADVLDLIAEVRGLNIRANFKDVLIEAARLAGLWSIVAELEGRTSTGREMAMSRVTAALPARREAPERDYPPQSELDALWGECVAVGEDSLSAPYLAGRAIDPDAVDARGLARALPASGSLPRWARCARGDWREAGYRVLVPVYAPDGEMRSVRAWRVTDGDGPKRLPPSGCRAAGLVMADEWSVAMLRGTRVPGRVVVCEGEPDFLTWATRINDPRTAVLGIVSGSWTAALAERFPVGARVVVRTDHDSAGDRYAAEVVEGLYRRCFVWRSKEANA